MKLTDIDLSSLADVTDAIFLLEAWRANITDFATLPKVTPELVANPAPGSESAKFLARSLPPAYDPNVGLVVNPAQLSASLGAADFGGEGMVALERALSADAEKLRGLGVDPMSGQPLPGALGYAMPDAAAIFGTSTLPGAPAQSAAPLPFAPSTAGVAPSSTAPAALPGSGALPALQALAPLLAASAAAPAAPAPQASPAGGVEVDTDGLPWDARIHAGTKRRNADGRWTSKKGINDPDLVPRVVAQLRAQMAAGGVTTLTQLQTAMTAPPGSPGPAFGVPVTLQMTLAQLQEAQQQANVVAPVQAQSAALPMTNGPVSSAAPTPPALPGLLPQAAPQPSSGAKPVPLTFQDFMTAMTVEVMSGRVPATALLEACKPYGGTTALAANPSPIPEIWAALKQQYPGML